MVVVVMVMFTGIFGKIMIGWALNLLSQLAEQK